MSKLTIFTAPKPFVDPHITIIQRNAVLSWKDLGPTVEVILIGDDPGIDEAAADLGVQHISNVKVNDWGTPRVDSIFSLARDVSSSDLLMYINADILLLPETLEVLRQVKELKEEFLIIGRRWDLNLTSEIVFNKDWSNTIKNRVEKEGKLQTHAAMDYFVFPKQLYQEVPSFAIGRAGWDNWMVYYGVHQHWPVIDITAALMVIHQNHDYSHLPDGKPHYDLEESNQNVSLGGGFTKSYDLLDVKWEFIGGKIRKNQFTTARLLRWMERFVMPQQMEGWRWGLTRILRQLRRKLS